MAQNVLTFKFGKNPCLIPLQLHPNMIHLQVIVPHRDGMLPIVSTAQLTNFDLTLSPGSYRLGLHPCSNLLDFDEYRTKTGFITERVSNVYALPEQEPFQYNRDLRGDKTTRFYR